MLKMYILINGFLIVLNVNSENLVFQSGNSYVHPVLKMCILVTDFLMILLILILRIWFFIKTIPLVNQFLRFS